MAVGARDYIDKLLVKKYADEKVDNHEAMESMINPDKMLQQYRETCLCSHKNCPLRVMQ